MSLSKKTQVSRTKKEDRLFYVFLLDADHVYINHTLPRSVRITYQSHWGGKNNYTKRYFELGKKQNIAPGMYQLETVNCTRVQAYQRCLAWAKLFCENGYEIAASLKFQDDFENLFEETEAIYQEIQDAKFDLLLAKEKNLFAEYGQRKMRPETSKQNNEWGHVIAIRVSDEEYNGLVRIAALKKITLHKYCREKLIKQNMIYVDYHFLAEPLRVLAEWKELFRQQMYTIYKTKTYYPADIENMQRMVDQIGEIGENIRRGYISNTLNLNRKICATSFDLSSGSQEEDPEIDIDEDGVIEDGNQEKQFHDL